MAILFGKAPGKVILFGEHAVVYGQPAIAIPVTKVNATAKIFPEPNSPPGLIRIQAPDIHFEAQLDQVPGEHPLTQTLQMVLEYCASAYIPAFTLHLSSTIPVSAGMGSSAAISVAVIRAVSAFFGKTLSPSEVSDLAYEAEKLYHGTPSGIDNNVISHQKPVYYMKDHPIQFLEIKKPTLWVIADTGEKTSTRETVSDVRRFHESDPRLYDDIFQQIGEIAQQAREALVNGELSVLGELMDLNQSLLQQIEVSSEKIDRLVEAARLAGAAGAKLSGGGRGGNIIALVASEVQKEVEDALTQAGAVKIITTLLPGIHKNE